MSYEWVSTIDLNVSPNTGNTNNHDDQASTTIPKTPTRNVLRSDSPICPGAPVRPDSSGSKIKRAQSTISEAIPTMSGQMSGLPETGSNNPISIHDSIIQYSNSSNMPHEQDGIMQLYEYVHGDYGLQATGANTFGTVDPFETASVQADSFAPDSQGLPDTNGNSTVHEGDHLEDSHMTDADNRVLWPASMYGVSAGVNSDVPPNYSFSSSQDFAGTVTEGVSSSSEQPTPPDDPSIMSTDDAVLLSDQQRGRLVKYRVPDEVWPPKKRAASVSTQCGDHYSYKANWPPQQPPRCDFGTRIDVFPPKDAPLHVQMQAYALRWGFWAANIKDPARRQQALDTVANKMKESWETAIGENYYLRPVKADDSDKRSDAEEKGKRGRKRVVSPSRQPAGFASEGKDALAITNGELMQHNLTMDMIIKRAQAKDFEVGEQALDEILESLGRDNLMVRDWSKHAFGNGSVNGRNLLMYCLFVVLECRKECRKLTNLLNIFTKELQKKNTRARIQNYQEREFQHMALATELKLAQEPELISSEDEDGSGEDEDVNMQAVDQESNQGDGDGGEHNGGASDDERPDEMSATDAQATTTDKELILEIAQSVLSAKSEVALYGVFKHYNLDAASFGQETGLRAGHDQALQTSKVVLGQSLGAVTRIISLQEMIKRQPNPNEVIKMRHDARLSYEKLLQARQRLAATLNLPLATTPGPQLSPQLLQAEQSDHTSHSQEVAVQQPNLSPGLTGPASDTAPMTPLSIKPDPQFANRAVVNTSSPRVQSLYNTLPPQAVQGALSTHHVGLDAHRSPQITDQYEQPLRPTSQTPSVEMTEDDVGKKVYIDEQWRPFINHELSKHGQPPYPGTISDWGHIRDILQRLGLSTGDRNVLLRKFKTGFDEWSNGRRSTHQTEISAQSPALSNASQSPRYHTASTISAAPSGWPTAVEVMACIPPAGIHANNLLRMYQSRVGQNVSRFAQLIRSVAFMDQTFMVYPTQQHAIAAQQQAAAYMAANSGPIGPPPGAPTKRRHSATSPVENSPAPAAERPHQIVKLKLTQEPAARLLPAQDETDFPEGYSSTEVNATRGFTFRHLPHSTLDQRRIIDDMITEYINKTVKGRRKTYYGQYITFKDPSNQTGPPIAHGFWDFRDGAKPEDTEWFYNGEDIPAQWMPKLLGVNEGTDNKGNDNELQHGTNYRDVYDSDNGRRVRIKFNTSQGQSQGSNQAVRSQQQYKTMPSGHDQQHISNNSYLPRTVRPSQLDKHQGQAQADHGRGYLDGNHDEDDDQGSVGSSIAAPTTKKRGTKRSASTSAGGNGRGNKGSNKRRKKDTFGDDDSDGDYVPGGD